jgi:hypothetical protein
MPDISIYDLFLEFNVKKDSEIKTIKKLMYEGESFTLTEVSNKTIFIKGDTVSLVLHLHPVIKSNDVRYTYLNLDCAGEITILTASKLDVFDLESISGITNIAKEWLSENCNHSEDSWEFKNDIENI